MLFEGPRFSWTGGVGVVGGNFVQFGTCSPKDEVTIKFFLVASWMQISDRLVLNRNFEEAIRCYQRALSVSPKNPSVNSAIGFTYHLQGNITKSIDYYHKALGFQPRDTFTLDMLSKALAEVARSG